MSYIDTSDHWTFCPFLNTKLLLLVYVGWGLLVFKQHLLFLSVGSFYFL